MRAGLVVAAAIGLGIGGFKGYRHWQGRQRAAQEQRLVLESQRYWGQLSQKRTIVLNSFVREMLPVFRGTLDEKQASLFSSFNRVGPEEGGAIFFDAKTSRFEVQLVSDVAGNQLRDAFALAKKGDFSQGAVIQKEFELWEFSDTAKDRATGQDIVVSRELLLEQFGSLQKWWREKAAAEKSGDSRRAAAARERISRINDVLAYAESRLADPHYDEGTVVQTFFKDDGLFKPDSPKRFFAHFHTHPSFRVTGTPFPNGPISKKDLENTKTHGPNVVFELGPDYNAVYIGVDGKTIFSKKYPK